MQGIIRIAFHPVNPDKVPVEDVFIVRRFQRFLRQRQGSAVFALQNKFFYLLKHFYYYNKTLTICVFQCIILLVRFEMRGGILCLRAKVNLQRHEYRQEVKL